MAATKKSAKKKKKGKGRRRPNPKATLWQILIVPGGTVPLGNQFMQISPSDSISFRNTAGFPVNVVFTNVFPPINNLPNNGISGSQGGASSLNVTLNFAIVNHNTGQQTGGPYAVQFGIGPLPISITGDDTNPDPVAIPRGGQIQFTNNDATAYTIKWTPSNVWSPEPAEIYLGLNTPPQKAQAGANGQSLAYTITVKGIETRGGGTVGVGS